MWESIKRLQEILDFVLSDYEQWISLQINSWNQDINVKKKLCIDMAVITQLYLHLYITYNSAISDLVVIRLDTIIREAI